MKKLWIALLACMSFVCMSLGVACSKEDTTKLAFNEGYLEEIVLGEPIMLDEYVDLNLTDDFTAILTHDETGVERDLKELVQWTTDKPGTYTLTYTVKSGPYKGKVSTKINVVVADADWTYSNPTFTYRKGDTMSFNIFKRNLNIAVNSYYDYEFYVKEVEYNGKAEDLRGKTSYTFPEHGEFTFTFCVETEDGQELSAQHTMTVRKQQVMAAGAQEWMDENNITVDAEGWTYISPDGYVELDAGYINGSAVKDHVPYLAFNGEAGGNGYGANTYVMADFTGKNLPQVAFFCNDVKPSFTDGSSGVLFYNGFGESKWKNSVHPGRMVIYGPNKISQAKFDHYDRMVGNVAQGDPCPASWNGLDDNCQYRYIVGIENATKTSMVARILLINLTNSERVLDYTQTIKDYELPNCSQDPCPHEDMCKENLNLASNYYSGSIVLYGRYGFDLTLDKVYTPITGISDIYELDQCAEFKDDFKKTYDKEDTANVADFIVIPSTDYEFYVVAPDGSRVEIDNDGNFTFEKSGTYRLYYDPCNADVRKSSTTIKVLYDLDKPFEDDQLEKDGALVTATSQQIAVENTIATYIKEGARSTRFYTIPASTSLDIGITNEFVNFVFMNRRVQGISFEIYSPNAVTYKLKPETTDTTNAAYLREDYTGSIEAETWTKVTLSRDLMMANYATYRSKSYPIALRLEGNFAAQTGVYVDNVQLVIEEVNGTVDSEAQAFMTENNITAYGYNSINADMSVSLQKGYYQGNPTHGKTPWMSDDDVPYIAYNGNYGAGSYVVVDFTGKNVPQLCFFAKEVTSSLLDGKAGVYVHTGLVAPNGDIGAGVHDAGRVTFFGPNKIEYRHVDSQGRLGKQFGYMTDNPVNSPLSVNGLVDGVHYRYVIGIKKVESGKFLLDQMLINLDTNTKEVEYLATEIGNGAFTTEYLSGGSIVMYGRYNYAITLDKIYDVYENVSNINDIDKVAEVLGA